MTTPTAPANGSEPMTLAEIWALLEQTTKAAAENTRAIIEMRAVNAERDARHDKEMAAMHAANAERDARHDKELAAIHAAIGSMRVDQEKRAAQHDREMGEIRAAIAKLMEAQHRTNQDVGTLKGWGLEIYCERNPEIFAEFFGLKEEDLIPKRELRRIASAAQMAGFITIDQFRNLSRADVFIYGRRISDSQPVCLVVEASYQVDNEDVYRAADRAEVLRQVLQEYRPRHLSGQAIPVVAGVGITDGAQTCTQTYGVTYVPVQNGNQLTTPPE